MNVGKCIYCNKFKNNLYSIEYIKKIGISDKNDKISVLLCQHCFTTKLICKKKKCYNPVCVFLEKNYKILTNFIFYPHCLEHFDHEKYFFKNVDSNIFHNNPPFHNEYTDDSDLINNDINKFDDIDKTLNMDFFLYVPIFPITYANKLIYDKNTYIVKALYELYPKYKIISHNRLTDIINDEEKLLVHNYYPHFIFCSYLFKNTTSLLSLIS